MVKQFVFVAVTGLLSYGALGANTVELRGTVSNSTCQVTVNGAPGPTTVLLPTVSVSQLMQGMKSAGATPFSIEVSACNYPGSYVSPRFLGNNLVMGALGNLTGPGYAKNVLVAIATNPDNYSALYLGDQVLPQHASIPLQGTGSNRYGSRTYYAIYSGVGNVTPGKVRASLQYAIMYP